MNRNYRPSGYYVSRNTSLAEIEEMEEQDRIEMEEQDRIEMEEREAWEEKWMIRWVAKSGQRIEICLDQTLAGDFGFSLSVNGALPSFYAATDIKPVASMPGIVSKIGNVGLSEERRNALRVIWKRRSEWFSQP